MSELKQIRWRQRFQNLNKAFKQLEMGVAIKAPSDIEMQGVIQSFEFTFELSWKTLKDYLESQGVQCTFPREVLKQAFQYNIIDNGEIWLQMLAKRNLLAHTYDEKLAREAHTLITGEYFPLIENLMQWLKVKADE